MPCRQVGLAKMWRVQNGTKTTCRSAFITGVCRQLKRCLTKLSPCLHQRPPQLKKVGRGMGLFRLAAYVVGQSKLAQEPSVTNGAGLHAPVLEADPEPVGHCGYPLPAQQRRVGHIGQGCSLRCREYQTLIVATPLPCFCQDFHAPAGQGLTRVCKIEIIATNRPHRPWIPAYAGMTEWARLDSGLRRNDGMGPIRNGPDSEHLGAVLYLSKPTLLCGLTFNCVKSQMKYIPLSAGQEGPVLLAGCHPFRGNGPLGRLDVNLRPYGKANLTRPCRSQHQKLKGQTSH